MTQPGGGTFTTGVGNDSQDDSTETGNSISGDYTVTAHKQETFQTHETSSLGTSSYTLDSTETFGSTKDITGNSISGSYTTTDHQTLATTLHQTGGDDAGTFSVDETVNDLPLVVTVGNSISGLSTVTQTGAKVYTVGEHWQNPDNTQYFTLGGGGTQTYSLGDTYDANSGDRTRSETGSDVYSLWENGLDGLGRLKGSGVFILAGAGRGAGPAKGPSRIMTVDRL